jgi:hypothetical protein
MIFQDNDLVAATAGRAFWILDDVAAIQNLKTPKETVQVFKPKDTYLIFGGSSDKPRPGLGDNPKSGVTFDYYLAKDADSLDLKLEVFDGDKLLRTYTNKKPKNFKTWPGGPSKPQVLASKKGYNRFTWNFRRENLPSIDKVFVLGGDSGANVGPGTYTLKLTLDEISSETEVTVLANPKANSSPAAFEEQQALLDNIESTLKTIHESVNDMRSAKSQLEGYAKLLKDNDDASELLEKGEALTKRIVSWEENLIQSKQKTFQDVINFNNKLNAQLINLKGYIDVAEPQVTAGAKERWADLKKDWQVYANERKAIVNDEMKAYNTMYKELSIPAIIIKN